jgi:hypothetical protein
MVFTIYTYLSVPADIQEPPDEDESVTEEPEQRRGESNPVVVDDEQVGSTTL